MSRDDRTVPAARFGARAVLWFAALTLFAVPFGLLLLFVQDQWPPLLRLDGAIRSDLHDYATQHPALVTVMRWLSAAGSTTAWLAIGAVVAGWLLWRQLPRLAAFVVVTTTGSMLLNSVVKEMVDRARPVVSDQLTRATGMSFPSGHAQGAIVGYLMLLLVFLPVVVGVWRRFVTVLAVVMVLAIGFSRMLLGVHYLSDVLAGYALGAAWVAAMMAAFNAWRLERGRNTGQLQA